MALTHPVGLEVTVVVVMVGLEVAVVVVMVVGDEEAVVVVEETLVDEDVGVTVPSVVKTKVTIACAGTDPDATPLLSVVVMVPMSTLCEETHASTDVAPGMPATLTLAAEPPVLRTCTAIIKNQHD